MSLRSTMKRTLALLLVLIFALSNMGLAEMAEEVVPDAPAIEEPEAVLDAEDVESDVEAEGDEAAPAEDETPADAEEGAPAEDAPVEEAAAEAELAVALEQLDEQSIWADVTGAAEGAEISYAWEVATEAEDGSVAWAAVETANEDPSIFSGAQEEVAWKTYRVTVTAGEATATSAELVLNPTLWDVAPAAAEAPVEAQPVMMMDSLDVTPVNADLTGATAKFAIIGASSENVYSGRTVVAVPDSTIQLKVGVYGADDAVNPIDGLTYKWEATEGTNAANAFGTITTDNTNPVTLNLNSAYFAGDVVKVTVDDLKVIATSDDTGYPFTNKDEPLLVLKQLGDDVITAANRAKALSLEKTEISSSAAGTTIAATLDRTAAKISEDYPITYSLSANAAAFLDVDAETGAITVKAEGVAEWPAKVTQVTLNANVLGSTTPLTATLTFTPQADEITLGPKAEYTLVGEGAVLDGGLTADVGEGKYTGDIVWSITGNNYGSNNSLHYLQIQDATLSGEEGWTATGEGLTGVTKVRVRVPAGMKAATPGKVTITAKAGSATGAKSASVTINVLAATTAPKNTDLDLPTYVKQPIGSVNGEFEAALKGAFAGLPVDWKVTDLIVNAPETGNTFTVTPFNPDDTTAYDGDPTGHKVTITADVTYAYDAEKNEPVKATLTGEVIVRPVAKKAQIVEMTRTSASSAWTAGDKALTGDVSVPVGTTKRYGVKLVGYTNKGGKEITPYDVDDPDWVLNKIEDLSAVTEKWVPQLADVQQNDLVLDVSKPTKYQIGVQTHSAAPLAAGYLTITVKPTATKIVVEADPQYTLSQSGTTYNFVLYSDSATIKLDVKPQIADGTAAYSGDLKWLTNSTTSGTSAVKGVKFYTVEKPDTEIELSEVPAGTTSLLVAYNADASNKDEETLSLPVQTANGVSATAVIRLRKAAITENPFGSDYGEPDTYFHYKSKLVAQDTRTAIEKAEGVTSLTGVNALYRINYTDTAKANDSMFSALNGDADALKAAIEKWVTVNATTGELTAKKKETGDKPANAFTKDNDSLKVVVEYAVVGTEYAVKANITVVSEPASAKILSVTNRAKGSDAWYKDLVSRDPDGASETDKIPKVISKNEVIAVAGWPVGPVDETDKATPKAILPTIEDQPTLGFSGPVTRTQLRKDGTTTTDVTDTIPLVQAYELKATGAGTVTINATNKNGTKATPVTITVVDETGNIVIQNEGDSTICANRNSHVWVLDRTANQNAGEDGHWYRCANGCGATGLVKHTRDYVLVPCGKHAGQTRDFILNDGECGKDEDGKGEEHCKIVCKVCEYECPHTKFTVTPDAPFCTYKDSKYHYATCDECGFVIYAAHEDRDGDKICDFCGGTQASIKVTDATGKEITKDNPLVVNVAKDPSNPTKAELADMPTLEVAGAYSWTTTWTTSSHFTYDAEKDALIGVSMTPAGSTDTLTATIVVTSGSGTTAKQEPPITVEIPVIVKDVPTTVTVTAEKDFVLASNELDENKDPVGIVKVTATTDKDSGSPDLSGFKWSVKAYDWDATKDGDDPLAGNNPTAYIQFLKLKDKVPTAAGVERYVPVDVVNDDYHKPVIYIAAQNSTALKTVLNRLYLTFTNDKGGDDKVSVTVQPIKYYQAIATANEEGNPSASVYGESDVVSSAFLTSALTLDKDTVSQGDSVKISMAETFDAAKYGTPTFKLIEGKGGATSALTPNQISDWASLSGTTVTTKVAGTKNDLSKEASGEKSFTVVVTVKKTESDGKTVKTYIGGKDFTIVAAPENVQMQYYDKDDDTWTKLTETQKLMAGDTIQLRAVAVKKDGTVDKSSIDAKSFTWNIDTSAFKVKDIESDIPGVKDAKEITLLSAAESKSTIEISATAKKGTQTLTAKATIAVQKMVTGLSINAPITKYAIGEQTTGTNGLPTPKKITLTAVTEPADAGEEFEWEVVSAKSGNTDVSALVSGLLKQVNTTNNKTVELDESAATLGITDNGPLVATIELKTNRGERYADDGKTKLTDVTSDKVTLTVYKEADGNALVFGDETTGTSPTITKNVTAGETFEFEMPKYAAAYGDASLEIKDPVLGTQSPSDSTAPAGTKVVDIAKQGDKWVVTALTPGTGIIEVHAHNWAAQTATENAKAVMTVYVDEKVDDIQVNAPDYEIYVGQPANETQISSNLIQAVYTDDTGAVIGYPTQANITLTPDNPEVVEVKALENNAGWQLTGKSGGTATLTASVGDVVAEKTIKVTVEDIAKSVIFRVDSNIVTGEVALTQNTDAITISAVTDPANAHGGLTLSASGAANYTLNTTDKTVAINPTNLGTTVITATIPNPDYTGSNPNPATNPENLSFHLDVVVVSEEVKPSYGATAAVEFVGKQAIGKGETTKAVLVGVDATDVTVTYGVAADDAAFASVNATTGEVSWVSAGEATIIAYVDGDEVASNTVYTLTEIAKVEYKRPAQIAIGETIKLEAEVTDGYDFAAGVTAEASVIDEFGIYSYTVSDNTLAQLKTDENGYATLTGLKKGSFTLTVTAGGATASVPFTVVAKKNTGFDIGQFANSTQYVPAGGKITVPTNFKPKGSFANLTFEVMAPYEGDADDISFKYDVASVDVMVGESAVGRYAIRVSSDGFTTSRQEYIFDIVVADEPASAEGLKIAVAKVGIGGSMEDTAAVTVVAGETLQAMVVDAEGEPVGGTVTWASSTPKKAIIDANSGLITAKSTCTANITASIKSGDTTLSVSPLSLTIVKAPAAKNIGLSGDTRTARTVALGEKFQIGLAAGYPGTATAAKTAWYSVESSEFMKLPITDLGEGWYVFDEDECSPGTTTVTLTTAWNKNNKSVKFTVVAPVAEEVELPEEEALAIGSNTTLRVKAETVTSAGDPAYADLVWTVGGTKVTTKSQKTASNNKVTVKQISNNEIEIKAAKGNAAGVDLKLEAPGIDIVGETAIERKIAFKAAGGALDPAQTLLVFDKNVIGQTEKTTATLEFAEGYAAPTGNITFKADKSSVGKVSVSGNVITGSKPGMVTVNVLMDGKETGIKGTMYVVSKPSISVNVNPKKMGEGEWLDAEITVSGYDDSILPKDEDSPYVLDASDILTVETSSDLIDAWLTQKVDPETDEIVPNKFNLTLHAKQSRTTAKGKYESDKVTINLLGKKAKTWNIQVVRHPEFTKVFALDEIHLAPGDAIDLNPMVAQGTNYAANIAWSFADPAEAEKYQLSFNAKGQLTVPKKSAVFTPADDPVEMYGLFDSNEYTLNVYVGSKVTNKSDFSIAPPVNKQTIGVGEMMQAQVKYLVAGTAGKVTWSSKNKKIATVDATTGVITGVKAGMTKITAKIAGKSNVIDLTVTDAPASIAFKQAQVVLTDEQTTIELNDYVDSALAGTTGNKQSAYSFEVMDGYYDEVDGTGIVMDWDYRTGTVTLVPNVEGMARVRVTSYNGEFGEMLLVRGQVTGGSGSGEPADTVPASIEMWLDGGRVSGTPTVALAEGKSFDATVVVKNAAGQKLSTKPEWVVEVGGVADTTNEHVEIADGKITAKKRAVDEYGTEQTVRVTAKVSDTIKVDFVLNIMASLIAENVKLEPAKKTLLVGDSVDFKVSITASNLADGNTKVSVKSDNPDVVEIADGAAKDIYMDNTYTMNAGNKAGTANVTVEFVRGTEKLTLTEAIEVINKPTADQVELNVPAEGLTLAAGEVFDVVATVKGLESQPAASDYKIDVVAEGNFVSAVQKSTTKADGTSEDVDGVFRVTGEAYDVSNQKAGTAEVTITLYDTVTKTFKVNVLEAPEVTLKPAGPVDAAKGEDVTLSYTVGKAEHDYQTNAYKQGLVWAITDYTDKNLTATEDITPSVPTLVGADTASVTIKYSGTAQEAMKNNDDVIIGLFNKGKETEENAQAIATVTIHYYNVPEMKDGVLAGLTDLITGADVKEYVGIEGLEQGDPATTTATIGVGEYVTAYLTFDPGYHTDSIEWESNAKSFATVEPVKGDPTHAKIIGAANSYGGQIKITANYVKPDGTKLELGSVTVSVVNQATSFSLKVGSGSDPASATWNDYANSISNGDLIKVEPNEGASATYKLTVDNRDADLVEKNVWRITATGSTLLMKVYDQDGKLLKTYNADVQ